MMFGFSLPKSILEEVKIFYFMSELFLEELSNIDQFTSKSILSKINFTKAESTIHWKKDAKSKVTEKEIKRKMQLAKRGTKEEIFECEWNTSE